MQPLRSAHTESGVGVISPNSTRSMMPWSFAVLMRTCVHLLWTEHVLFKVFGLSENPSAGAETF